VNTALDKSVMHAQRLNDFLIRGVRAPWSDLPPPADVNMELPTVQNRAGRIMGFDAAGRPAVGGEPGKSGVVRHRRERETAVPPDSRKTGEERRQALPADKIHDDEKVERILPQRRGSQPVEIENHAAPAGQLPDDAAGILSRLRVPVPDWGRTRRS
jgi:hypothetical protein